MNFFIPKGFQTALPFKFHVLSSVVRHGNGGESVKTEENRRPEGVGGAEGAAVLCDGRCGVAAINRHILFKVVLMLSVLFSFFRIFGFQVTCATGRVFGKGKRKENLMFCTSFSFVTLIGAKHRASDTSTGLCYRGRYIEL